ncbi:MAG TPA: V-type ATPase subunit, partial [Anaerolineae bacterium]
MTDFHYGNTRLRAMKSQLLSLAALDELTTVATIDRLLNALTETHYRTAVEAALIQHQGLACLQDALQRDLIQIGQKIRGFFSGKAAQQVGATLQRYDIHNVKTILRGLAHNLPADEILESTLPLGELQARELATLAAAEDMQTAVDLLVTWRTPLAQSLLAKPLSRAGLFVIDMALEQWHFEFVMNASVTKGTTLRQRLLLETDIANVLTALRLVGVAELNSVLPQHFGS